MPSSIASEKFFSAVEASFEELLTAETMYFYLVDEVTGIPVHQDSVLGPMVFWDAVVEVSLVLIRLAILPTDRRTIRAACLLEAVQV